MYWFIFKYDQLHSHNVALADFSSNPITDTANDDTRHHFYNEVALVVILMFISFVRY